LGKLTNCLWIQRAKSRFDALVTCRFYKCGKLIVSSLSGCALKGALPNCVSAPVDEMLKTKMLCFGGLVAYRKCPEGSVAS